MAPSRSTEPSLTDDHGALLLDIAEASLRSAFERTSMPRPSLDAVPPELARPLGAFVTLHVDGQLNGCIGTIEGTEPLVGAVARLARSAAFEDPRLPALRSTDLPGLEVEVSVLSPLEPVPAISRAQLLAQVQPMTHGLLIRAAGRSAVFLPDVWDQLAEPDLFLDHLLAKARLPLAGWLDDMWAARFTTQRWSRPWRRTGHAGDAAAAGRTR